MSAIAPAGETGALAMPLAAGAAASGPAASTGAAALPPLPVVLAERTLEILAWRPASAGLKRRGWLVRHVDPRRSAITRVGRFLRRYSLDELPELLKVLRGEMSLAGPRPLIPDEDSPVEGWVWTRLNLKPSITGLWQVLGRSDVPFEEMVTLDYRYVTTWSFWQDFRLLLRTIPVVVTGPGGSY